MTVTNSILSYEDLKLLQEQLALCKHLEGYTAEIGVYKGNTSKIIASIDPNKKHYCYDTFEGICNAQSIFGDVHKNGDFHCTLDEVKRNINRDNVIYKKGFFPNTFEEDLETFCFVYSDTATYYGARDTYLKFQNNIPQNGKILFYVGNNDGVHHAIQYFINDKRFDVSYISNIIIFTRK